MMRNQPLGKACDVMYEEQNYSVHEKVTLNYNHYYIFTSVLAPKESRFNRFVLFKRIEEFV